MPSSAARFEPGPRLTSLLLIAILVVAAALRLPTLGAQSLWRDEAATWWQASGGFADVFTRTASDNYPPLYNLLSWASLQVFGDAEWALRLPAALLGLLNIWLLYLLGARLGGRTAGLFAAGFLALSGFHVWYSQEARMYTLLACAATWHGYTVIAWLERQFWQGALPVILSGTALVYSHPFGALTWLSIGATAGYILAIRRNWSGILRLALISAAVGLAFLPWALILLGRARSISTTGFWLPYPSPTRVWSVLHGATNSMLLLFIAAACLMFWRRTAPTPQRPGTFAVLLGWTILPTVLGVVVSLLVEPVLHQRYIIGSLPPLILLASLGIASALTTRGQAIVAATVAATLSVLGLLYSSPGPRHDWRGATAYLDARLQAGDCVAVDSSEEMLALRYYHRAPLDCLLSVGDLKGPLDVPLFVMSSSGNAEAAASLTPRMYLVESAGYHRLGIRRYAPHVPS